jgi:hypothetical protein
MVSNLADYIVNNNINYLFGIYLITPTEKKNETK